MKALFLSALLIAAAACASNPRQASPHRAAVQAVSGSAEIAPLNGSFAPARSGQQLAQGATVRTGPDSEAHLTLGAYGGTLTLHPDSLLTLEQIGPANDPEVTAVLNLARGRVTGDTLRLPSGRKIVVKTPNGVHEIR